MFNNYNNLHFMKSALVRLLLISTLTLMMLFCIVVTLRQMGFLMAGKVITHPLMERDFWPVVRTPEDVMTSADFSRWIEKDLADPKLIPWVDLRRSFDGQWFVAPREWIEIDGQKKAVHFLPMAEISAHWPDQKPVLLEQVLALGVQRPLWLNIIEKESARVKELEDPLQKIPAAHLMVHSPIRFIAREIRKDQPGWIYASDGTTVNRFLMMTGFFLETLEDFWPDIFFSPPRLQNRDVFSPRMQAELKRRGLPVVIDVSGGADLSSFDDFPIKGLVARSPEEITAARESLNR